MAGPLPFHLYRQAGQVLTGCQGRSTYNAEVRCVPPLSGRLGAGGGGGGCCGRRRSVGRSCCGGVRGCCSGRCGGRVSAGGAGGSFPSPACATAGPALSTRAAAAATRTFFLLVLLIYVPHRLWRPTSARHRGNPGATWDRRRKCKSGRNFDLACRSWGMTACPRQRTPRHRCRGHSGACGELCVPAISTGSSGTPGRNRETFSQVWPQRPNR